MGARKTRKTDSAATAKATARPKRTKTTLRLGDQVRRELAVLAAAEDREMSEIAEEGLLAHLGRFRIIRDLRRQLGVAEPVDEPGPADDVAGDASAAAA